MRFLLIIKGNDGTRIWSFAMLCQEKQRPRKHRVSRLDNSVHHRFLMYPLAQIQESKKVIQQKGTGRTPLMVVKIDCTSILFGGFVLVFLIDQHIVVKEMKVNPQLGP
jgi:hypothetical protein